MFDDMTDEELEAKVAQEDSRCDPNYLRIDTTAWNISYPLLYKWGAVDSLAECSALSLDEEILKTAQALDACLTSLAEKESQLELNFTGTTSQTQTPPPKKNNRLLLIAGGTALLGGSYYIYRRRS
jgi:hypothetical protein